MEEVVAMGRKELDRAQVIGRVVEGRLTQVTAASSPQAKGRIERGFHTHQDRLVKELRLRGI